MQESDLVFNVVWTGEVFHHLRWFLLSLLDRTGARFRFVVNNCTAASVEEIHRFAAARSDRVVEVLHCPYGWMVPHGTALDVAAERRHDGEWFCFIDADIKARGPFLGDLLAEMRAAGADALTSGAEVWTDDNVLAAGAPGIGGRHFVDEDGFVYGSPHFGIYRRDTLDRVRERWGIGFHVPSKRDMPDIAWGKVRELGRDKLVYDTGKVLNILWQAEHRLVHVEHEAMVHIGGLSHFLAPPEVDFTDPDAVAGRGRPLWINDDPVIADRAAVAEFTAAMLRELDAGRPAPPLPTAGDPALLAKLALVRDELIEMVDPVRLT